MLADRANIRGRRLTSRKAPPRARLLASIRLLVAFAVSAPLALATSRASATTLFGLINTGAVYASTDGGATWNIRSSLPFSDAVALGAGATNSKLFLATASGHVLRSVDAGASWTATGSVAASDVSAMVLRLDRMLLFCSSGEVFASTDDGASFTPIGAIGESDIVSAARQANTYFALSRAGEVWRSRDGGMTWTATAVLSISDAVSIAELNGDLYVLDSSGDVAHSDAQGQSWSFVGTLSQSGMAGLTSAGTELIAVSGAGEAAASASGSAWAWRGAIGQLDVQAVASDLPSTSSVGDDLRHFARFQFAPPLPNPSRGPITLSFEMESDAELTVEVFDASGRAVARPFVAEKLSAGRASRIWRPTSLRPGAYFVRAQSSGRELVRPIIWLGDAR
jgi:photosystem II stability/assembly factor-like uncharacterized protein